MSALKSSRFGFLMSWWRLGMLRCLCVSVWGRKRDVLCSCCAFSAVLSGFGHALPCEAWGENLSHGVIMTNPPPRTQPPFSSSITCQLIPFFPLSVHIEKFSMFFCVCFDLFCFSSGETWQYGRRAGTHDWIELLTGLFSLSSDCHVYLSDFHVSVTVVESLGKSLLVCTTSRSLTVYLCISLEPSWNVLIL